MRRRQLTTLAFGLVSGVRSEENSPLLPRERRRCNPNPATDLTYLNHVVVGIHSQTPVVGPGRFEARAEEMAISPRGPWMGWLVQHDRNLYLFSRNVILRISYALA